MKFIILIFALLSSGHVTAKAENILILGDSLSAGYGINIKESWPALLQNKINDQSLNFKIHNASISGQTSAEGLAQIKQLLKLSKPKLVILELGANDGLRGLSIHAMQQNLQTIISQSQLSGANVILLGISTPANYGRRYGLMFSNSFKVLAKQNGITLIADFLMPLKKIISEKNKEHYIQTDGLHPTSIAQPILLEYLWPFIEAKI